MHAFIYLFDAFGGLENISCLSLSSSVFVGRTLMWGARKRLARIKRHHRRAGGLVSESGSAGGDIWGGQAATHSLGGTQGQAWSPSGRVTAHSCRGRPSWASGVWGLQGSGVKCLPATEEAAAFGSLLNEEA